MVIMSGILVGVGSREAPVASAPLELSNKYAVNVEDMYKPTIAKLHASLNQFNCTCASYNDNKLNCTSIGTCH